MPKVTEQYRDARREHILRAARNCFLRDGFQATSMQDLFAEAGLSSGAVYGYFASKDEMILAIAEDNLRDVIAMLHTVVIERPTVSIGTALAEVIDLVYCKNEEDGLAALAVQVWAEALRNPPLAKEFKRLVTRVNAEFATVVSEQQASGGLPTEVSAKALVSVFVSIVPGYLVQLALLGPAPVRDTPAALRALWPAH